MTAVLSGLALGTSASRVNAQAAKATAPAPPPPLTVSDPTTKPLVPNPINAATTTAAFKYVSSEKQSPVNPWPNGGGDAQNRARGASDLYWGILEGDVPWDQTPLARARVNDLSNIGAFSASSIAQGGLSEDYTSLITLDGWTFPRLSSQNGVFNPVFATNDPNFTAQNLFLQEEVAQATTDGVAPASGLVFTAATAPSTGIQSTVGGVPTGVPTYYVAAALPRPAVDALTYDAGQKFVWRLDNPQVTGAAIPTVVIPGAIGQQVRYRIIIHVPNPADGLETRVDDARYVVYYYVLQNGAYIPMQNICIASQITGGDLELKNLNGSTAFFPMFSTANFSATGTVQGITLSAAQPTNGGTPPAVGTPLVQGVSLDNTSGDNTSGASIVADTITLEPSSDQVTGTPTITPPHGGAVVTNVNAATPASPVVLVQPQSFLPDLTDAANLYHVAPQHYDPNNNTYNSVGPATGAAASVQSFINNIDDTQYGGTNYAAFQPWNVSTVFQGPASLIDPRFGGVDSSGITYNGTGAQIGLVDTDITNRPQIDIPADPNNVTASINAGQFIFTPTASANATNNWVYGGSLADPTGANAPETPAPYFSHIQVVIARTEYAQDPNDPSGTSSIQVGAIYALDWQTGAPVWRFPDRSYLPQGATFNNVIIPGAGLRNPMIASDTTITGVFQPVFQVPGIVAVDRNGDGFITDDEIYIGATQAGIIGTQRYVTTAGNNVSGGVFNSVTIAPKVLVQGDVLVPVHPTYATIEANFQQGLNTADISGVAHATPGRYYGAPGGNGPTGDYGAVPVGMAFIAAANGVLYAVDAYGNNDTRYFPGNTIGQNLFINGSVPNPKITPNGLYFGQYLPGTTNLFWSFSATIAAQKSSETTSIYHNRVLGEIPATNSFGGSSPVLAWNYTDTEIADYYAKSGVGYLTPPELRLFVGNTNGVIYALDPTALTGINIDPQNGGATSTGTLPILKGVQPTAASQIVFPATAETAQHQGDLRWWFQTQGAINLPVSVSAIRHNMGAYGNDPRSATAMPIMEKAVYAGTQEGHMYAFDWDGPVTRPVPHSTFLANTPDPNGPTYTQQGYSAYDGTTTAAAALNDDYYFHNILPATTTGIADQTYGNVRPRWTYPNLYFDIGAGGTELKPSDIPDKAQGVGPNAGEIGGVFLAASSSLGPIATAPMLMDFWWADPDNAGGNGAQSPPSLVSYVAFIANDPTILGTPATQSRVYLLDAIGDRVNLLTNPRATPVESPIAQRRVISQPRDKYSPHVLLASAADPTIPSGLTWTYRYQNDAYEAPTLATPPAAIAQTPFDVQLRNSPFYNGVQGGTLAAPGYDFNINTLDPSTWMQNYLIQSSLTPNMTTSFTGYLHQPGRRMLPTLFAGGVGEIYALDIDPETALFMRWRPSAHGSNPALNQEQFTPLPNRIIQGLDPYPGDPQIADANGNILFGSMAPEDALDPPDHVFDTSNNGTSPFGYPRSSLANNGLSDGGIALGQQILARYYGLEAQDLTLITSMTVTGGPMQNRNNVISENGVAQAMPSIPAYPTNDVPNLRPFSVATITPPTTPNGPYIGANPSTASLNQSAASATNTTNTLDYNGLLSSTDTGAAALVPGGHFTGAVNQDINDSVTTKRGAISSLPASHPGIAEGQNIVYPIGATPPAIANATFQYPILFATTTGSFLHGISTNIEGEDRQGAEVSNIVLAEVGDSRPVSWSFLPGNPGRFNARHTQVLLQFGPGGPSGIADMSNVYFPAIDPYALAYRNTVVTVPPTTTPYSLNETPNFIADEPNVLPVNLVPATGTPSGPTGLTGLTVQDPDDPTHPRPDFKPRPLTAAQVGAPGVNPTTVSDTNTGDTGFPLDLNGLFFDRQFAGAAPPGGIAGVGGATQFPPFVNGFGYSATLNYNNDNQFANGDYHVWLRTPGYSNVGARLVSPTSGNNSSLSTFGLPTYGDNNNQIAEGVRHNDLLDLPSVPSPFPQIAGSVTGPGDVVSDDINPAGQNVAWIYVGSNNGVVYAYTPSIVGHESGFGGGEGFAFGGGGDDSGYNGDFPQVGIFPASYVNQIISSGNFGTLRQAAPSMTVAAQGGRNYYEWGETIYIVAYDLLAQSFDNTEAGQGSRTSSARFQAYVPNLGTNGGTDGSVTLTITDKSGGTQSIEHLSLRGTGADGNGSLITYYYNGTGYSNGMPANRAAGTPLGIAIYPYVLTGSPTQNHSQTPGSQLQVTVGPQARVSGGVAQGEATERPGYGVSAETAQNNGIGSYFSIANPLALQGFLASTVPNGSGQIVPVSPLGNMNDYNPTNPNTGIGPFSSNANQGLPGEAAGTAVKKDDMTTLDPNKVGAEYWQALTNGNTIQRTDLHPYTTYPALNPHFQQPIVTSSGITEQAFYIPVMTSPGYVNHGTTGSTAVGTDSTTGLTQEYFRALNRSLLGSLGKVRALPVDVPGDLLFRAWPGVLMNTDADAIGLPANSGTNARNYPSVAANGIMDPLGRINPLAWESVPSEAKPWTASEPVNISQDYSDILTRANNGTALQIVTASGDITASPGTLTSVITPAVPTLGSTAPVGNPTNLIVSQIGEGKPAIGANSGIAGAYGTAVNVRIPLYQPANLVAVPTATSTYLPANRSDYPSGTAAGSPVIVGTPGPVQIPRGLTNRILYQSNTTNPQAALAPFGYTAKVVVFIDNDGTNRLVPQNSQSPNLGSGGSLTTGGKAYRIFEVWAGVPVDESMKIKESTVDLGAAPHGMGMQNGLLGYNLSGADSSLLPGFLPPTINGAGVLQSPYAANFKQFTILGTANVNMYNLRASQKVEANPFTNTLAGDGGGSGLPFSYFQLGSGTVDSRFGIMAAGADPLLPGQTGITNPNVMPQIVTSLDRPYDVDWNALIRQSFTSHTNNAGLSADIASYYSAAFAGRHPLPKALPNATSPSVFGIPAAPSAQPLIIDNTTVNVAQSAVLPQIGVSVPLGTPVGEYTSSTSNSPFSIFEDHDTLPLYIPTPSIVSGGGSLTPVIHGAGPMYGGRNDQYPVTTGGAQVPMLPTNGEGVWRAEAITTVANATGTQYRFSYLPYTYPFLSVQVKVTESPLTGQFPDFAGTGGTGTAPVVTTGVLPSLDLYPLETPDNVGPNNTPINRPTAALTPASWRDAAGNLHVYLSRNATAKQGTGASVPPYGAEPGAPYKLYASVLAWNATVGSWQAQAPGSPIAVAATQQGLNPTTNTGQWFTPPTQVLTGTDTAANPGTDSDTSPFVLAHSVSTNNGLTNTVDGATLFYMNSMPTVAGTPSNNIYYVDVTNDGTGAPAGTPQLYFTGGDPALLRYTPRVAYANDGNNLSEDFLFYYGGQRGRWSIYYVPRTADNKGLPTGTAPDASVTANVETPIIVPDSIVSASEPAPVFHQIYDQRVTSTTAGKLIDVMDVYYTGISRATQTPDIYMNRYRIASTTANGVTKLGLAPLALPRVVGEQLSAINHQSLWRAQNIAWISDLSLKNTGNPVLPVVSVTTNGVKTSTVDANWQYDPASGVLYQVAGTTPKGLTYIYVDASAGTVRFRGAGAPGQTDIVTVDYTPQAYRLTSDGASNFGPYTFTETRALPATVNPVTGNPAGTATSPLLIRRSQTLNSGRNWLFWQKGATASNAPTLFSAERRVGVDLGAAIPAGESVQLTVPTAANNYTQTPVSVVVSVAQDPTTGTFNAVPDWEFEYGPSGTGRVYIDPIYEGLPIKVTVQTVQAGSQSATNPNGNPASRTATGFARYVDELNYSANNIIGSAVEIGTGLNEGQASAFLDLFDARGITRANNDPAPITDPALVPGKVWLFWSSPRGKANVGYPNGYNTYWETIAPVFEAPLVPTPASK